MARISVGGCCGTTPAHIKALSDMAKTMDIPEISDKKERLLSSERMTRQINLDGSFMVVGERINPTGKKKLQAELREGVLDTVMTMAEEQMEKGASMLQALAGKADVDDSVYKDIVENRHDYNMIVQKIREKDKKIGNCKAEIAKCQLAIDGLKPWINMDVPINTTGTEHTDVIMGSLGPGLTENMIEELVAKRQPELSAHEITVISSDKDQTM